MLHVTERAKELLLEKTISARIHNTDTSLRLASVPGGKLVLLADRPKAGDQIVTHGDSTVLLIDGALSRSLLAGRTVDCKQRQDGGLELVVTVGEASPPTRP